MKKHLLLVGTFISSIGFSQVGVNTNEPKATLEVVASPSDNTKTDGIIAPRLTGDELNAKDALYGADQVGAIVYVTSAATTSSGKTKNVSKPGYFFFDGTTWELIGKAPWNVQGTNNVATNNDQNIYQKGSVALGINKAHNSAILDLDVESLPTGGKKGFLAPRVSLTSRTDTTTIPSPAVGLLVYNMATPSGLKTEGYHYWNGTEWRLFSSSMSVDPEIGNLLCIDARFNPPIFTGGAPYTGIMTIPYTGGNGGSYGSANPIESTGNTGLKATLRAGTLLNGEGQLVYDLSGIPAESSPNTANFAVSFLGKNCNASLKGDLLQVGETYAYFGRVGQDKMWWSSVKYLSVHLKDLPVIEGLRIDIEKQDEMAYRPYLYNTTNEKVKVRWQGSGLVSFSSGNISYHGNILNVKDLAATTDPNGNMGTNYASIVNLTGTAFASWDSYLANVPSFNIVINEERWYRVEFFNISDSRNPIQNDNNFHNIRISVQRLR